MWIWLVGWLVGWLVESTSLTPFGSTKKWLEDSLSRGSALDVGSEN